MPPTTDPELVGRTLQVLQPLLLHPEPLVWVHAARALGRLTGPLEQLEGTLLDWVLGESRVLRQRAMTAFASLPAERLTLLGEPARGHPRLARGGAVGARGGRRGDAVPVLRAAGTSGTGSPRASSPADGGAIAARALARGLATLWRRGARHGESSATSRRPSARCARWPGARAPTSLDEARRWIEVIAVTDAVDGAERDPLDLELGLENLMRLAAQYDDEEADARAARFAGVARADVPRGAAHRARARAGCGSARPRSTRSRAARARSRCASGGRCWRRTPAGEPIEEPDLEETWKTIARAPAEILDLVEGAARRATGVDLDADLPLEVLAIRLGGYALDACGEDSDLGPGPRPDRARHLPLAPQARGPRRRLARAPAPLEGGARARSSGASSTRRAARRSARSTTCAGSGPFAAWWALVIDRPAMLAAARDGAADDGRGRARAVLRAGRGAAHGGLARASPTGSGARRRPRRSRRCTPRTPSSRTRSPGSRAALEAFARRGGAPSPTSRRCASSSCSRASGCTARSPIR